MSFGFLLQTFTEHLSTYIQNGSVPKIYKLCMYIFILYSNWDWEPT